MAIRTIRHVSFSYREPIDDPAHPGTTIYAERRAPRGAVVDIPLEEDLLLGEKFGAFEPEVVEDEAPPEEEVAVSELSIDELVTWIQEEKPTVREMVDAAENDPDNARKLLDAEDKATGGNSRQGVVNGLTAIISQAQ